MNAVQVPTRPGGEEPFREDWPRTLFEAIDDAVFVHDLEGRFLEANPAACRRLGYTRDEFLGLTTADIDAPEFAAGFRERLQAQLARGHLVCEGRHVTRDGRVIPVEINTSAIEVNGRPAVLAVARDITERKRMEQALQESEALYHSLVESLPLCILRKDLEGRFTFGNRRFLETLGRPPEQVVGRTDYDFYPAELARQYRRDDARVLASGEILEQVEEHQDPGGSDTFVEILKAPVRDAKGDVVGVQCLFWDVTPRKRAERRLAAQHAVTRALAESATLAEAAPKILEAVCRSIGWDAGVVWGVDPDDHFLRAVDLWHQPDLHLPRLAELTRPAALAPGEDLPGKAWSTGEALWPEPASPGPGLARPAVAAAEGLPCALAVPVRTGPRVTGVLELYSRRARPPDPDLVAMMADLGSQVGQFVERQRSAEETRRANAFLEAIVENIPTMLFVKDAESLRFQRVNKAAETLLGYRREDLIGKSDYDFFPREQADFFTRKDREVLRARTLADISEEDIETRQGRRVFHTRKLAILDERGEARYLLGISEDVTERKALEETRRRYAEAQERHARELEAKNQALQSSEALYHSLVESLPQSVYRKDARGRYTFANQRFCAGVGRPLGEVLGKTVFDLFPRDQAEKFHREDLEVLRAGKNWHAVEELTGPDGATVYIEEVKIPLYDYHGEVVGTQGIFWDVTENRRAQEALRESERRYRQLTEAALDAIVVADREGRVTLFNPAAERAFGYPAAEVLGRPLEMLIPGDYRDQHRRGFQRFLRARPTEVVGRTLELRGRRRDGTEFPLELSLSAVDLGGELQFLGAIRDLTERNRMRTVMVQTEKLAAIGLLSAGVAHEVNNPLAYVANNLVVLERDVRGLVALVEVYEQAHDALVRAAPEAVERVRALAEDIDLPYVRANLDRLLSRTREGVHRVTRIVHSLSSLARTAPPELEEVSVPDLVEGALEIIRGQLRRRGIEVAQRYGPVRKVRCVSNQLSQVLLNLLVNAMHAIEARGPDGPGRIEVATEAAGEELLIEVADNGCGIDPKDLPRLFDPFFTTKPVGEGTGLGLSITHNIVTGHRGRIEVDSRPGAGSRFRVFLPLEPPRKEDGAGREGAE